MRVAVLMGGTSDERPVSLASGAQVARALRDAGHEVLAVDTVDGVLGEAAEERLVVEGPAAEADERPPDPARDGGIVALVRSPELDGVEVFFLALHGGAGEDGTVQALLELAGVAYTGSDRLGCALAMDKEVSKRLLRDAGLDTPAWLADPPGAADVVEALGLPVILKASGGGSSLRLALAHTLREVEDVLERARAWGDLVLAERFVAGREVTVGILGEEALPVGEIVPEHEFFDYACKYRPGMAREIFPASLPEEVAGRVAEAALHAHRVLRLRDYSRVDFIVDEAGRPWCLEANALPGMTANSLLPKAAAAAGLSFPGLCDRIVRLAAARKDGVRA